MLRRGASQARPKQPSSPQSGAGVSRIAGLQSVLGVKPKQGSSVFRRRRIGIPVPSRWGLPTELTVGKIAGRDAPPTLFRVARPSRPRVLGLLREYPRNFEHSPPSRPVEEGGGVQVKWGQFPGGVTGNTADFGSAIPGPNPGRETSPPLALPHFDG